MRTEEKVQTQQGHLSEGVRLIFNQESSLTPRSSRSSSRSSSSSSSSSSSDSSYSSSDGSRSPSVSRRSWRRRSHGSRYSSSSSSSSRSHPRCCRASDHSRCRHRHRSRSYSPYPRRSSRYGRRRYSRSSSRSSSRERYYRRSRRSRSSSYSRTRGAYAGRFRYRFSPSPVRRYYRHKSRSPECSIRLSQKDKMNLLNIARENAAKILGVEAVKLPASVKCSAEQVKQLLEADTEKRVRADPAPLKKPPQDEGEADGFGVSRTSPARNPIRFSISNTVAKPSSSPTLHVTETKVTSRADSAGNRRPYGQWIPVKTVSPKKR